jgi:hypothetical protein
LVNKNWGEGLSILLPYFKKMGYLAGFLSCIPGKEYYAYFLNNSRMSLRDVFGLKQHVIASGWENNPALAMTNAFMLEKYLGEG